jgi:hypothetical protein
MMIQMKQCIAKLERSGQDKGGIIEPKGNEGGEEKRMELHHWWLVNLDPWSIDPKLPWIHDIPSFLSTSHIYCIFGTCWT